MNKKVTIEDALEVVRRKVGTDRPFWPSMKIETLQGTQEYITGGSWVRLSLDPVNGVRRLSGRVNIVWMQGTQRFAKVVNVYFHDNFCNTTTMMLQSSASFNGPFAGLNIPENIIANIPLRVSRSAKQFTVVDADVSNPKTSSKLEFRAAWGWKTNKNAKFEAVPHINEGLLGIGFSTASRKYSIQFNGLWVYDVNIPERGKFEFLSFPFHNAEELCKTLLSFASVSPLAHQQTRVLPKITPENRTLICNGVSQMASDIAAFRGESYMLPGKYSDDPKFFDTLLQAPSTRQKKIIVQPEIVKPQVEIVEIIDEDDDEIMEI